MLDNALAIRHNGKARIDNLTRDRERRGIRSLSVKRAGQECRGNYSQSYFHKMWDHIRRQGIPK